MVVVLCLSLLTAPPHVSAGVASLPPRLFVRICLLVYGPVY